MGNRVSGKTYVPCAAVLFLAITGFASAQGADGLRQCVGRFCFVAPASMARSADTYNVLGVTLEEVAWDPTAKDPWEREFAARLAGIEKLKKRRETASERQGTILEQRVFNPGSLRGVLFNRHETALGTWGALLNAGPRGGLWLSIDASAGHYDEAIARIQELAAAYRPREPGAPAPEGAFHLARGYIAAPFRLAEEAHARFKGHPLGLDLSVSTETTFETAGLAERLASRFIGGAQMIFGGRILDAKVKSLRNKRRTVAGLPGDETIYHEGAAESGKLYFQWRSAGKKGSGMQPEFTIETETTAERVGDKTAIWDALLDSFNRAP
jgi:hypothetical protein